MARSCSIRDRLGGGPLKLVLVFAIVVLLLIPAAYVAHRANAPGTHLPNVSEALQHAGSFSDSGNATAGLSTHSTDGRAVVATFLRRSYRPGERAVLRFWRRHGVVRVVVLHVGGKRSAQRRADTIIGVPVGRSMRVAAGCRSATIEIGDWDSGVYAARLTADRKTGFAPFIVRPGRLGQSRVAVVQPTNTWQAYNYRDDDSDGHPDTWYHDPRHTTVNASRPYLDRGVPPHFNQYDFGFLRWLIRTHKHVDMLAQEDVERLSGDRLAQLYRLIVFPGHHEYVTASEYRAILRYRALGGDLAFLSANNFFWRVDRRGGSITRVVRWRDVGESEAGLVGVQYFQWNLSRYAARPYVARGVHIAPWLFKGTGIQNGDRFGWWGIEIDGCTSASPRSTRVLADIPNAFGTGRSAEMTYYETGRGARVFAAGAFTLGGAATVSTASRLLENLWDHFVGDRPTRRSGV